MLVMYTEREQTFPLMIIGATIQQIKELEIQMKNVGVYSVCEYHVKDKFIYLVDANTKSMKQLLYNYFVHNLGAIVID